MVCAKTNKIIGSILVRLKKLSPTKKSIEYYNMDNRLIASVLLDEANRDIDVSHPSNVESAKIASCSGDKVAHCISDMYSEEGWVSVGLWVSTVFVPETAAVVAGACVRSECFGG